MRKTLPLLFASIQICMSDSLLLTFSAFSNKVKACLNQNFIIENGVTTTPKAKTKASNLYMETIRQNIFSNARNTPNPTARVTTATNIRVSKTVLHNTNHGNNEDVSRNKCLDRIQNFHSKRKSIQNTRDSIPKQKRRDILRNMLSTTGVIMFSRSIGFGLMTPTAVNAVNTSDQLKTSAIKNDEISIHNNNIPPDAKIKFKSSGFGKEEYTNSITASRDTNISPKEAYDTISSAYISQQPVKDALLNNRVPKALDLGAGAGVSTQLLYEMGYRDIDAVDWSGDAWRSFVGENEANGDIEEMKRGGDKNFDGTGVRFWEMDDERFLRLWRNSNNGDVGSTNPISSLSPPSLSLSGTKLEKGKYDAIVYNFAVNESKAKAMASEMLTDTGKLLAPVNIQTDYWLKQSYRVYDKEGKMLWQTVEVGAWTVQFQPDVTQDTCQGIWCAPFNGFQKLK